MFVSGSTIFEKLMKPPAELLKVETHHIPRVHHTACQKFLTLSQDHRGSLTSLPKRLCRVQASQRPLLIQGYTGCKMAPPCQRSERCELVSRTKGDSGELCEHLMQYV
jgi:hypothetical protein